MCDFYIFKWKIIIFDNDVLNHLDQKIYEFVCSFNKLYMKNKSSFEFQLFKCNKLNEN